MGIPGFLSKVQPYATSLQFEITNDDKPKQLIIDGPALAHFIFSQEILASGATNTFASTLTYHAIGEATVDWLSKLEAYNGQVKAIYFDGGLPISKRKERLDRLTSSLNRLISFKAKQNIHTRAWALGTFPPLPFLVPAVIEALLLSKYQNMVSLVDGEADDHCATLAHSTGGIVITSDSDLIIHDIGDGTVVFLNDLGVHMPTDESGAMFSVPCFIPRGITRELGVTAMTQVAFQFTLDSHKSLRQCASAALSQDSVGDDIDRFAQPYLHNCHETSFSRTFMTRHLTENIMVDPRVSEYLLHAGVFSSDRLAFSEINSLQSDCRIYMPVLLDDPDKHSPWDSGRYFRQLGYAIARLNGTPGGTREFSRIGHQIGGTYIDSLSQPEIIEHCQTFIENATHIAHLFPGHKQNDRWRLMCMRYVCITRISRGRRLPSKRNMVDLFRGATHGIDWEYIQTSAEYQAVLYSLRILFQCLAVHNSMPSDDQVTEKCKTTIRDLVHRMQPPLKLAEFLAHSEQSEDDSMWERAVTVLLNDLASISPPTKNSQKARKGTKQGKRKRGI
ncbi:hypothetical protein EJ05DRAFT_497678 [Pseudovirgaria hyperparasitica]|uniref:Asteroid domain-containing protein n=1 Tax=Pseudovirgaria hyperparasitica TaxID=470096 RepID=A0A6A6WFZ7_9PEZI|nr:uncharacterized protein EJ05DRAFT_497678 [Pseudovirgaria hyperparasitica]KAF2761119.1 hypothetical protein EJ05DRAFT_497678 [Pseudovirgaria hyperparasitica]